MQPSPAALSLIHISWGAFLLLERQWWKGAVLLFIYGLCYFIRQFLEAKLMGSRMGLSALETLFSMYVGLELFGVSGFFLGPVGLLIIEDLVKLYGCLLYTSRCV